MEERKKSYRQIRIKKVQLKVCQAFSFVDGKNENDSLIYFSKFQLRFFTLIDNLWM